MAAADEAALTVDQQAPEIGRDRLLADAAGIRRKDLRFIGMQTAPDRRLDRVFLGYSNAGKLVYGYVGSGQDSYRMPYGSNWVAAVYTVRYRPILAPRIVRVR